MKVLIVCSTSFYDKISDVRDKLVNNGHMVYMPNCYDDPIDNVDYDEMTDLEYLEFFKSMYNESRNRINDVDAILVLNYTKKKNDKYLENYVGASTFLEMYEAFMQGKKIFMMNDIPDNMLFDEIKGFNPIILNGNVNNLQ